jgi:hypothetical protein
MSTLAVLSLEMRRISERIHKGERLMAAHPESPELIAGQIADRNLMGLLKKEFERAAERLGRPVARYTILNAGGVGYDMGAVGSMLTGYRHLYGLTRTALETRQRIDTFDHHTPFSLGWGYVADGTGLTFGMVETVNIQTEFNLRGEADAQDDPMIVQEETLLLSSSGLLGSPPEPSDLVQETTHLITSMVKSQEQRQLAPYVERLGRGPIRALAAWATAHAESGSGVDAEWCGTKAPALRRAAPQIENLAKLLRAKSKEERTENIEVEGVFLGGYADTRRFRFQGDEGKVYHGRVDRRLNERPKGYPARYRAIIEIRRGKSQATDEDFEDHKLLELTPIK